LKGDKQENRFKKETRGWRDAGYFDHAPEIIFPKSKKNERKGERKDELVQLADLLIYNLSRYLRGVLVLPEMERLMKAIYSDNDNVIRKLRELEV
jgi:hypothetical protein